MRAVKGFWPMAQMLRWIAFAIIVGVWSDTETWHAFGRRLILVHLVVIVATTFLALLVRRGLTWLQGTGSNLLILLCLLNLAYFFVPTADYQDSWMIIPALVLLVVNTGVSNSIGGNWQVWWDRQ